MSSPSSRRRREVDPGPSGWSVGLHGNVPGHQLDWIRRPPLGEGRLRPHQLAQLLSLIRNYDVPSPERATLTLGNLSKGMEKQGPGRDAIGLACHFRVGSRLDHGGRLNPRFVAVAMFNAPVASAMELTSAVETLVEVTGARALGGARSADRWYGRYVDAVQREADVRPLIDDLLRRLRQAPSYEESSLEQGWAPRGRRALPQRLVVTHADELSEEAVRFQAQLAFMLSRSSLPWHSVTTCRVVNHLEEGLVVQVLPAGERLPAKVSVVALEELGLGAEAAAQHLLDLQLVGRERFVPLSALTQSAPRDEASVELTPAPDTLATALPGPLPSHGPSTEQLLADARVAALLEDTAASLPAGEGAPQGGPPRRSLWRWLVGLLLLALLPSAWAISHFAGAPRSASPGAAGGPSSADEPRPPQVDLGAPREDEGEALRPEEDALPPQAPQQEPEPTSPEPPERVVEVRRPPPAAPEAPAAAPLPATVALRVSSEQVELRSTSGARRLTAGETQVPPGEHEVWVRFAPDAEWVSYGRHLLEPGGRLELRCAMWSCRVVE